MSKTYSLESAGDDLASGVNVVVKAARQHQKRRSIGTAELRRAGAVARQAAEELMVCTTHRWSGMDSNSAFRAALGSLVGPRDARSGRGDRSHQSSFRLTAINKRVRRAISW